MRATRVAELVQLHKNDQTPLRPLPGQEGRSALAGQMQPVAVAVFEPNCYSDTRRRFKQWDRARPTAPPATP
jgi:hypothetical protein